LLRDGLWLENAAHANGMAGRLSAGLVERGLRLAAPTEANEVFVNLEPETHAAIAARYAIHAPDTLRPIYRFVCSWATTDEDVDAVLALLP
ncbi:MAG TPA: threonine aldolase, partial [Mycobacterium sp.]